MPAIMARLTRGAAILLGAALCIAGAQSTTPQSSKRATPDTATKIEIYGYVRGDVIIDFRTNDPVWFDVNRPSKLPATQGQFGQHGHTWFSARASRFGTKATIPTGTKEITVAVEWDLFGVGADSGQTTIRPRLMYGQWGNFGAGQRWSPFMDVDAFPNILDYWGPNGILDFRNVQLYWQPVLRPAGTRLTLALERPGGSGDDGVLADRVELLNIKPRFPAPDISAEFRRGGTLGYAKLGAIVRWLRWDDVSPGPFDLSGGVTGWGAMLSGGINAGPWDVLHLQTVYGAGVENYIKDAPNDVGPRRNPGNVVRPVTGEALPVFALEAFLDHTWNCQLSSAIGYSRVDIDNSDLQAQTALHIGQYALFNLLWTPLPNVMAGGELQWAHRNNLGGDFHASDYRLELSLKYSFSQAFTPRHAAASPDEQ
jgi:hypothetical protein